MGFLKNIFGRQEEAIPTSDAKPLTVYAPVKGTVINQQLIPDETFASGIMGKGVGIEPEEGVVVAPFHGVISAVVDTRHAVGITSEDGMELLIHVGVDTVNMNGEGFRCLVEEGQQVSFGQQLIEFDIDKILHAGYKPVTAVLVTNSDEYSIINIVEGDCELLKEVITLRKQ